MSRKFDVAGLYRSVDVIWEVAVMPRIRAR